MDVAARTRVRLGLHRLCAFAAQVAARAPALGWRGRELEALARHAADHHHAEGVAIETKIARLSEMLGIVVRLLALDDAAVAGVPEIGRHIEFLSSEVRGLAQELAGGAAPSTAPP